jgi:DNA-binding HxlR family transcriptional regulator
VLNSRLRELREAQLIERNAEGYVATKLGRELYDHLVPLGAWAKKWGKALPPKDKT